MRARAAAALLAAAVVGGAAAETLGEAVPAATLIAACERFSLDVNTERAVYCEAFVRGVVGALLTEGALRAQANEPRAVFEDRAAQTRAGMRIRRLRPPPVYCVAGDMRLAEIVERLLDRGRRESDLVALTAAQLLRELFESDFSCTR